MDMCYDYLNAVIANLQRVMAFMVSLKLAIWGRASAVCLAHLVRFITPVIISDLSKCRRETDSPKIRIIIFILFLLLY